MLAKNRNGWKHYHNTENDIRRYGNFPYRFHPYLPLNSSYEYTVCIDSHITESTWQQHHFPSCPSTQSCQVWDQMMATSLAPGHWKWLDIYMGCCTGQGYRLSLDSFKASNTLHEVLLEKHWSTLRLFCYGSIKEQQIRPRQFSHKNTWQSRNKPIGYQFRVVWLKIMDGTEN